jgi:hypothetical protein
LPALVLAVVVGVTTTALRVAHLRKADADGESRGVQAELQTRSDLICVIRDEDAIFMGIVFLMTVKPDLEESLVGIGAATAVGGLASLAVHAKRSSRILAAPSRIA